MAYDGSIRIDTSIDSKGFNQGINGIMNGLKGVAAAVGVAFGVAAIVNFGKEAVQVSSDIEEMTNKFNVVFKSLAQSVSQELATFAAATNGSKYELMGFAAMLQDTFVPLGFARDKAADMSVQVVKLATDLGSFNNLPTAQVIQDIQSALVGQTETVRKYGVVLNVERLEQEALAMGLIKTGGAMDAQARAAATLSLIMKGNSDAIGDAERTSMSFANQMRGLDSAMVDFKLAIGDAIKPVILLFIPYIKAAIQWLTALAQTFAMFMQVMFGVSAGVSAAVSGTSGAADAAGAMAANTEAAANATGNLAAQTSGAADSIGALTDGTNATANATGNLATGTIKAASAQSDLADSTTAAGKAAKGALASFDELNVLAMETPGAAPTVPTGPGGITPTVPGMPEIPAPATGPIDAALEALKAKLEEVKQAILDFFAPLAAPFERLKAMILELGGTIWQGLLWAWENILVPLGTWLVQAAAPVVIDLLTAALKVLNSVLEALAPLGKWLFDNFLKPLADLIGQAVIIALQELTRELIMVADWIDNNQQAFQAIVVVLGIAAIAIWAVTTPIAAVILIVGLLIIAIAALVVYWPQISQAASDAWAWIVQAWGNAGQWFNQTVVIPVAAFFSDLWTNISTWAVTAWTNISTWAANAWKIVQLVWFGAGIWFSAKVTEPIRQFFAYIWDRIALGAADTWTDVSTAWEVVSKWYEDTVINPVSEIFRWMFEFIGTIAYDAWVVVKFVWSVAWNWFKTTVIDPLSVGFYNVLENIKSFFANAWFVIQVVWQGVSFWFQTLVITPVQTAFDTALSNIYGYFNTAWSNIKIVWEVAKVWFDTFVLTPVSTLFHDTMIGADGSGGVYGYFSTAWSNIKILWIAAETWFQTEVADKVKRVFDTLGTNIGGALSGAFEGIKTAARSMLNYLITGMNNMLSGLAGGVNAIINNINAVGSYIPGFKPIPTVPVPSIPYLAKGAVIPPNAQFLAVMGDQKSGRNIEAPEALIRQIVKEESGNQGPQEITINFAGNLGALVKALKPYIDQENARVGKSLISGVMA
jgi:hypothetical protein